MAGGRSRRLGLFTPSRSTAKLVRCTNFRPEPIFSPTQPSPRRDKVALVVATHDDDETLAGSEPATPGGRSQVELRRGTTVGRYIVLEQLGRGGMGIVYAAYDPGLDRKLALKVLHESAGGSRQRALREAQALAKLSHPNAVAVHDVGEHDGSVYVAMEFIEGMTLGKWRNKGERSWREVVDVYAQAGRGLAAAHERGLVHRDFKPDNAMLDAQGRVRVLDFGLAKLADTEPIDDDTPGTLVGTNLTHQGDLIGTPAYMAPEQHARREAGPAADQFAFCVAMWEALYGEHPFDGSTAHEKAVAIVEHKLRDPPSSGVPRWLRRAVRRGLSASPSDRWPNMVELLAELERGQSRRRRVRVLVMSMSLAGVVGLGFSGHRWIQARAIASCEREGAELDLAWNDDTRARVRSGMLATGIEQAAGTLERVMPKLEDYARAWSETRTELCIANEVDLSMDDELADRGAWCLATSRFDFDELVDALTHAAPKTVMAAVDATAGLHDPAQCKDLDTIRQQPAPPAERRDGVLAVRRRLSRAHMLGTTGGYEQGRDEAKQALEAARQLRWAPLIARAEARVGELHERNGDYDQAEAMLEEAFLRAVAADDTEIAQYAAERLTYVVGARIGRYDDGMRWSRVAEALAETLPRYTLSQRAAHLRSRGAARRAHADFDAAKADLEEALTLYEASIGLQHPHGANVLSDLGHLAIQAGRYREALELYRRVVEVCEATFGSDHPITARALVNMAAAHQDLGELDQALEVYRRALPILEGTFGSDYIEVAQTVGNIGNLHAMRGDYASARESFEKAVEVLTKAVGPDHYFVGMALNNVAAMDEQEGDFDAAIERYERSIEIFRASLGDEHPNVTQSLSNLGNAYRRKGDLERAKELYEQALPLAEAKLGADHPDLVDTLLGLGRVELAQGRADSALALAERAVAIRRAAEVTESLRQEAEDVLAEVRAALEP